MALSEARKKANKKWDRENLEKVQFDAPKGYNDKIKKRADEKGMSKAGYMKKLIDDDINRGAKE